MFSICDKFGFAYTWIGQGDSFVKKEVCMFVVAEGKLRRPTVAKGRCCFFFAVALGKEGKKIVKRRIYKNFEQSRNCF